MKWYTIRHNPLPDDRTVIVMRDDLPDYEGELDLCEKKLQLCQTHVRLYHKSEELVKDVSVRSLTHWREAY